MNTEKKKTAEVRLQKFLADAGIASRRKAEEYILQGKVKVNGQVVTSLGTKINPDQDIVYYNDKKVEIKKKKIYLLLNKPENYVTTVNDQFNRPTVMNLLHSVPERVYPVGRLDYNTSGLLLLTNDGDLTYKITHPKHHIDKVYLATVKGIPSEASLNKLRRGVVIDDYKTAPAKVEMIHTSSNNATLQITIHEGRNRQVRKMCEAIGHPVIRLKRIAIGKILLGDLPVGKYRSLTPKEIDYLKNI
ncbi:pseudouridine synthase [Defluviitalea raffinosedens]|uniref:Pseudouridine synthase n=1 Tax=Defluviitalea raffinosedens TaxID=1450156 RepID=A0A7C8HGT5_9FIRM|nr:pseudouridine synthase [Defluviitalea raffinosedens]KAE9629840.1 pseudouridine synthase [Defluviitalea raffinosedens]MBM7686639.1 23S rRNA pseudouridine2605 synthase [Defluviitalea raffinosedens]HHW67878.1 rRNA pseudouridine synthase [Candidatus Epulonipiscium sp.]